MDRFNGINITRSVVTIGDGNKVDARWEEQGNALSDLRAEIASQANVDEEAKLQAVTYIDTIEGQLGTHDPDPEVIKVAWAGLRRVGEILNIAANLTTVATALAAFL